MSTSGHPLFFMEHIFQTGNLILWWKQKNRLVFSNNLTTIEPWKKKKMLDNQCWRHMNCDSATWVKSCFNIWYKLVHLSLSLPFHSLVDYVEVPSLVRQWNRLGLFIAESYSCFFTALTHKKRSRDGNRAPCLRIHLGSLVSLLRNIVLRRRVGKTPLKKYKKTHTDAHKAAGGEMQRAGLNGLSALSPPYTSQANSNKNPTARLTCHYKSGGVGESCH